MKRKEIHNFIKYKIRVIIYLMQLHMIYNIKIIMIFICQIHNIWCRFYFCVIFSFNRVKFVKKYAKNMILRRVHRFSTLSSRLQEN